MAHSISPLVSVIIPGYNHAPFLKKRIEGVLAQTYHNIEVIMLDDFSTDNSAGIMQSYKEDERVSHIIINDKNTGNTFKQWEKGISLAKGEYIWIAESDDDASPDFLTFLMKKLLEYPDATLAFCRSQMIDTDGKPLNYSWDETKRYKSRGVYEGKDFCLHRMVFKNLLYNASMIVFRKRYYYNINNVYQQYRHSGDWLFWFEMCMLGKVCEVPEELNGFRQHPDKVSNDARSSGKDFEEMAGIQRIMAETLSLSAYQRRCLRGRQTKRLMKSAVAERLTAEYPDIYGGTLLDKALYTVDKMVNLSRLQG